MGTAAVVIGAIAAVAGAGATAYQAHQAAEDREDEQERLEEEGRRQAELHRQETEELTSKQRALYAASGVLVDEGSPLAVIEETRRERGRELEDILSGYGVRSDRLSTEASRLRTTGFTRAGGTLLSGIANYATSPYAKNPFARTASPAIGQGPLT